MATNPYSSLQEAIPGLSSLTQTATNNIEDLLHGNVSPSITRNATATFGAKNGLGTGSGIGNRYGYDLYKTQAKANQQTGLNDLLSFIGGYSGNVAPSAGQNLQHSEFQQQLGNQRDEFNKQQQMQLMQLLSQLAG